MEIKNEKYKDTLSMCLNSLISNEECLSGFSDAYYESCSSLLEVQVKIKELKKEIRIINDNDGNSDIKEEEYQNLLIKREEINLWKSSIWKKMIWALGYWSSQDNDGITQDEAIKLFSDGVNTRNSDNCSSISTIMDLLEFRSKC